MNAPPENATGGRQAARRKTACSTLIDDTPLACGAQGDCEHSETRIEILPPGSVHFAKELCLNCERVLRFMPKPATAQRQHTNAFRVAKLTMCNGLTSWEREFVKSVAQQRKLSPKQQSCLDRICAERLGDAVR